MDFRIKRKDRLSEFTIKEYGVNAAIIAALFLFGLFLSWDLSAFAALLYFSMSCFISRDAQIAFKQNAL